MRFRGKYAFQFTFVDAGRRSGVGGGDMLGNIGEHVFTALHIFVEKIGSQLRIENTRGANSEQNQQQNRDEGDEETSHDEAVAQAPEQAASSPGEQAVEKIEGGQNGDKFQVIEDAAAGLERVGETAGEH